MITPDEVMYRPAIGWLRRTRFAEVSAVEQRRILAFGGVGGHGALLRLKDGIIVVIPLNLTNHEDVFKRLLQGCQHYVEIRAGVGRDLR